MLSYVSLNALQQKVGLGVKWSVKYDCWLPLGLTTNTTNFNSLYQLNKSIVLNFVATLCQLNYNSYQVLKFKKQTTPTVKLSVIRDKSTQRLKW